MNRTNWWAKVLPLFEDAYLVAAFLAACFWAGFVDADGEGYVDLYMRVGAQASGYVSELVF